MDALCHQYRWLSYPGLFYYPICVTSTCDEFKCCATSTSSTSGIGLNGLFRVQVKVSITAKYCSALLVQVAFAFQNGKVKMCH